MTIHRARRSRARQAGTPSGDSLIEVLIALSLMAVTALGIIGAQTWLARSERTMLNVQRATLIADSIAEGIRQDADRDPVLTQWRGRAASMLPEGDVNLIERGDGLRVAVVKWRASDSPTEAAPCIEPEAGVKLACVAVAFAR
jgi:Tfp pilus assembly protein PilV